MKTPQGFINSLAMHLIPSWRSGQYGKTCPVRKAPPVLTHLNAPVAARIDDAARHHSTEDGTMRNAVGAFAVAAAILMSSAAAWADDERDWGPRWPMMPGYGMGYGMGGYGPGGGMGPGYGMGYGPGGGMGPGYGMGPGMMGPGYGGMGPGAGMMGPGGMRGYAGRPPVDTDHDGVVSNTEAAKHFEEAFGAMDGDDDGKVTLEELTSVFFGPGPHMAGRGDGLKHWQERKEARLKEMDGNSDGAVTQEEFLAYGKKRFEASDRDKNGKVTVWEFLGRRHF
jgi:hypothetical protein